jgi:hypothetical protein
MPTDVATHRDPVWRDRADFAFDAKLPDEDSARRFEQLWARELGDGEFEICCIPFFVYDLALADRVVAVSDASGRYFLDRVVYRSGRYVFRVWFGGSDTSLDRYVRDLEGLGALMEWGSPELLAVDARDEVMAQRVADYLQGRENAGELAFETGRLS